KSLSFFATCSLRLLWKRRLLEKIFFVFTTLGEIQFLKMVDFNFPLNRSAKNFISPMPWHLKM
ncbi:Hypothetical protein FKW44_012206, partial [Caligus rogercresseyi]